MAARGKASSATKALKAGGVNASRRGRSASPQHEARRGEIVGAAVQVIARDGLAGASLRSIAREIDYTTGVVMHYFKGKEDLLLAVAEAVFAPFDEVLADVLETDDVGDAIRRVSLVALPTTKVKQQLARIYAQAIAGNEAEPVFAETCRQRYGAIRQVLQKLLARGQSSGSLRADFDPSMQCDILCALIDGLTLHAISEPARFPASRLTAIVNQEVEKLRV